jgi:hypothetical protein
MKTITRASVMNFWVRDIRKNNADYIDCGEFNTTAMGEMAADHFDVMSDDGNTPIEQNIFDWAVEFSQNHVVSEFN